MPSAAPHICVVGSSNVDLTFCTERLPRPGETLTGRSFRIGHGGKGANQAVMAARLGARVTMISRVGGDPFGDQTLEYYRNVGIDTSRIRVDPSRSTGVAAIIVDSAANNCILVVPGANDSVSVDDVCAAEEAVRSADMVVAQCETPLEATVAAFRIAKAAGAGTILNPAPARPLTDELLRLADFCIPNETELEALTGLAGASLSQVESAARSLLARGPRSVLVTLGARGVLAVTDTDGWHCPALKVTAVDPTGAGDAFIGSLAVYLAQRLNLREAVNRANAVAALSVTRRGAQDSFPSRGEVDDWSVRRCRT